MLKEKIKHISIIWQKNLQIIEVMDSNRIAIQQNPEAYRFAVQEFY